jgi:hypothetical protein
MVQADARLRRFPSLVLSQSWYQTTMNDDAALCLACSSSLPPRRSRTTPPASTSYSINNADVPIFVTRCCSRPICPTCVFANPRLARYDPCLACLGGVDAVGGASRFQREKQPPMQNIDGALRDEDTFVLGDDEEEEEVQPPPQYLADLQSQCSPASLIPSAEPSRELAIPPAKSLPSTALLYHIKPGDTVHGLALRFGIDVSCPTIDSRSMLIPC